MIIKHFFIHIMYNILYVDKIKIIKYLKMLQHVSHHRGTIIREPCVVLGYKLQEWYYRVRWHGQGRCYGSILWPVVRVCSSLYMKAKLKSQLLVRRHVAAKIYRIKYNNDQSKELFICYYILLQHVSDHIQTVTISPIRYYRKSVVNTNFLF